MVTRRRIQTDREDRLDRAERFDRPGRMKMEKNYCGSGHIGYGLGIIGAAVYFVSQATTTWGIVLGILKAIVWPAFAVYGLLGLLGV